MEPLFFVNILNNGEDHALAPDSTEDMSIFNSSLHPHVSSIL